LKLMQYKLMWQHRCISLFYQFQMIFYSEIHTNINTKN
jgi:hypothetical protein